MNTEKKVGASTVSELFPTEILPAEAIAVSLRAGEILVIEDVEGTQVGDLVVFLGEDFTERFSPGNTRKLNQAWLISEGDLLYSTKCRPLMRIIEDTVGRNDLLFSSCSPYDYPIRFGVDGHASCLEALAEVLAPFDIPEYLIPDPFNVFQNTALDTASGAIDTVVPLSKPGGTMRLRAEVDCLVALSACPQDLNPCNGGTPTPLKVEVSGPQWIRELDGREG